MSKTILLFSFTLSLGFIHAPDIWAEESLKTSKQFWEKKTRELEEFLEKKLQLKLEQHVKDVFNKHLSSLFSKIRGKYRLYLSPLKKLCGETQFLLVNLPKEVRSVILESEDNLALFTLTLDPKENLEQIKKALFEHFSECYKKSGAYQDFERLERKLLGL